MGHTTDTTPQSQRVRWAALCSERVVGIPYRVLADNAPEHSPCSARHSPEGGDFNTPGDLSEWLRLVAFRNAPFQTVRDGQAVDCAACVDMVSYRRSQRVCSLLIQCFTSSALRRFSNCLARVLSLAKRNKSE
jgi:hypothetical protein